MADWSEGMQNIDLQPLKSCFSTTTMSMVTKLGKVVTYQEGPLPIKSYDPLKVH